MDGKNPKLFIHGIYSSKITETTLKEHFSEYGEIIDAIVIAHKRIGYVTFSDPSMAQHALQKDHIILGQRVKVKRAKPKVEKQLNRKIFVGGLPDAITYEEFTEYFEEYGEVTDAVVMYNNETGRSRGFGFITYHSEEAAKGVLQNNFHTLKDKRVEVKWATPRDQMHFSSITNSTLVSGTGSSIYNVYSQPYYDPSLSFGGGYHQLHHPGYGNYQSWGWDHPLPCYIPYCGHPYCNNRMYYQ